MIVFKLKEFSYKTIDDVFRLGSRRICIEIMKCVEMFEVGSLTHWLNWEKRRDSHSHEKLLKITLENNPKTYLCLFMSVRIDIKIEGKRKRERIK